MVHFIWLNTPCLHIPICQLDANWPNPNLAEFQFSPLIFNFVLVISPLFRFSAPGYRQIYRTRMDSRNGYIKITGNTRLGQKLLVLGHVTFMPFNTTIEYNNFINIEIKIESLQRRRFSMLRSHITQFSFHRSKGLLIFFYLVNVV